MTTQNYDPNTTPEKKPFSLQLDVARFEKASETEKLQQDVMSESTTFLKDGLRRLRRNKLAMFGVIVLPRAVCWLDGHDILV